jgi:UDP:flavonoid glycosyltransferase YjiC (YdhE family)
VRILYGVSNGGTDHTLRARDLARELLLLGHEVTLAAAGRAARLLRGFGFEVVDLGDDVQAALDRATLFHPDVVLAESSYFARLVAHLTGARLLPVDGAIRTAVAGSHGLTERRSS